MSSESARWKTFPAKNLSPYALAGVDGTVACAAGPRAAESGVAGNGTEPGDAASPGAEFGNGGTGTTGGGNGD